MVRASIAVIRGCVAIKGARRATATLWPVAALLPFHFLY